MCEAERPISLMKCQYLRDELASRMILPISSEYTLVVSKPNDTSIRHSSNRRQSSLASDDLHARLMGQHVLS